MDALQSIQAHLENLNLPEGDYLTLTNHLKDVYKALPAQQRTEDRHEDTVEVRGYTFVHHARRLALLPGLQDLFKSIDFFITITEDVEERLIRLLYDFAISENATWEQFETDLSAIVREFPSTTLAYRFIGTVIKNLTDDWREDMTNSKTCCKAVVFVETEWKNKFADIASKHGADGIINGHTYFQNRGKLVSLSRPSQAHGYHKLQIEIQLNHPMFTNEEEDDWLVQTLTLYTRAIRLGGDKRSVGALYIYVAVNALLNNQLTTKMIKTLNRYDYSWIKPWRMSVSGITARTRKQHREYTCDFARCVYTDALNDGGVISTST